MSLYYSIDTLCRDSERVYLFHDLWYPFNAPGIHTLVSCLVFSFLLFFSFFLNYIPLLLTVHNFLHPHPTPSPIPFASCFVCFLVLVVARVLIVLPFGPALLTRKEIYSLSTTIGCGNKEGNGESRHSRRHRYCFRTVRCQCRHWHEKKSTHPVLQLDVGTRWEMVKAFVRVVSRTIQDWPKALE